MTLGRLIAVVGPSGVGKDSIMRCLADRAHGLHLVRRVITRAADLGGEDYDPVSTPEFEKMISTGAFALHWQAHGLMYGIPKSVQATLTNGADCLVNLSRRILPDASEAFPNLLVLNVTARPETIETRLIARGRETDEEIKQRLSEAQKQLPNTLNVINVSNDGAIEETATHVLALLQSEKV